MAMPAVSPKNGRRTFNIEKNRKEEFKVTEGIGPAARMKNPP